MAPWKNASSPAPTTGNARDRLNAALFGILRQLAQVVHAELNGFWRGCLHAGDHTHAPCAQRCRDVDPAADGLQVGRAELRVGRGDVAGIDQDTVDFDAGSLAGVAQRREVVGCGARQVKMADL